MRPIRHSRERARISDAYAVGAVACQAGRHWRGMRRSMVTVFPVPSPLPCYGINDS